MSLGRSFFALELLQLAFEKFARALLGPARIGPFDDVHVIQHAGELVHGQSLGRLRLVVGIAAIEVRDDQVGRRAVIDEMAADPFDVGTGARQHGR